MTSNWLLLGKQHLASFPHEDIYLLAKYFNIDTTNYNDLLWLLTLKIHSRHAEMPPLTSEDGEQVLRSARGVVPDQRELIETLSGSLSSLPDDALIHMAQSLDRKDIINLCQVSNEFNHRICKNEIFWERHTKFHYPKFRKNNFEFWREVAEKLSEYERLGRKLEYAIGKNYIDIVNMHLTAMAKSDIPKALNTIPEKVWRIVQFPVIQEFLDIGIEPSDMIQLDLPVQTFVQLLKKMSFEEKLQIFPNTYYLNLYRAFAQDDEFIKRAGIELIHMILDDLDTRSLAILSQSPVIRTLLASDPALRKKVCKELREDLPNNNKEYYRRVVRELCRPLT